MQALAALDDVRIVPLLAEAVRDAADFASPPWTDVQAALDAIVKLAKDGAGGPLARMIREHPDHLRTLACEALATLGPSAERTCRALLEDDDEDVRLEGAWGLLLLGDSKHVIQQINDGFIDIFAVRLVKLGERGIHVLCGPGINREDENGFDRFGDMAEHIASRGGKQKALLVELAAGGSELATLALARIPG